MALLKLSDEQRDALSDIKLNSRRQEIGMAKWTIVFHDGTNFPYLTDQCRDRESAFLGAVQRFGSRVKDVI